MKYYTLKFDSENAIENVVRTSPAENEVGVEFTGAFSQAYNSLPYVKIFPYMFLFDAINYLCNILQFCYRRFPDGLVESKRGPAMEFISLCYQVIVSIFNINTV